MQKLADLLARKRSVYSVLIGIILLTLPCYIIGAAALAIAPRNPSGQPTKQSTVTATLLSLSTSTLADVPTQFVPATAAAKPQPTHTAAPVDTAVPVDTPQAAGTTIPTIVRLTEPHDGQQVRKSVNVMGTVTCQSFNYYKLNLWSISNPACNPCVLPAPNDHTMVTNGKLLNWDTKNTTPGDYALELVAVCFGTEQNPKPRINIQIRR